MVQDHGREESCPTQRKAQVCNKGFISGVHILRHLRQNDSDDEYPLPIQTYTTLKDRQLKEMLQEYNLPITGDRSNWEQRHQWHVFSRFMLLRILLQLILIMSYRWVTLYNANLDRSKANRKKKTELRKDLKKWEDELSKRKKVVVPDIRQHQVQLN